MKNRMFFLLPTLAVGMSLFLNSCQESCDPVDVDAINSIYLQFNTEGEPGSFTPEELDSLYFIRYQPADVDSFLFPVDTFNIYDFGFYEEGFKVRLGREHPIGVPTGAPYYTEFMYRFLGRGQNFQVRLQSIDIQGSYLDDCTYDARLKRYMLNDDTLTLTGSTEFIQVFKD